MQTCRLHLLMCDLHLPMCDLHLLTCDLHLAMCELHLSMCGLHLSMCELHLSMCKSQMSNCKLHLWGCSSHFAECGRLACFLQEPRCRFIRSLPVNLLLSSSDPCAYEAFRVSLCTDQLPFADFFCQLLNIYMLLAFRHQPIFATHTLVSLTLPLHAARV